MIAGKLDRRIEIQQVSASRDSFGAEVKTYSTFATVWANYRPLLAAERYASAALHSEQEGKFTIRWQAGIVETMRIVYNSLNYEISGIAELGRHEGLELTAKVVK